MDIINYNKQNGNWYRRNTRWIVLVMIAYVASATIFNYIRIRIMHFDGRVEQVSYSRQGHATVFINKEKYDLSCTFWSNSEKIAVGDKLIKISGNMHLKIIKPGRRDTIDFYSEK